MSQCEYFKRCVAKDYKLTKHKKNGYANNNCIRKFKYMKAVMKLAIVDIKQICQLKHMN